MGAAGGTGLRGRISWPGQPRADSSICPESWNLIVWGETPRVLEDIISVRQGSGSFWIRCWGVGALASSGLETHSVWPFMPSSLPSMS